MSHAIRHLDYHCSTSEKAILKDINRFAYDPEETSGYHGNLKFHRDIVCKDEDEARQTIEKMDKSLIEASKDLGAGPVRTFLQVTLPLTKPGIFAAVILTFIPCIGYYMITDMLGGGTTMLIGNVIYNQFTSARDWPFGAALSCILAAVILILMYVYTKLGGDLDDLGA